MSNMSWPFLVVIYLWFVFLSTALSCGIVGIVLYTIHMVRKHQSRR